MFRLIELVAPSNAAVLLFGESGTGKELAARAIHVNSPRASGPFVAINCAALSETLLESELFGHEKGAFTGAVSRKKGRLEVAQDGTVFLDEIGEMSLAMQSRLVRFLQTHEIERVGGTNSIELNVRMITATNRNLEEAVTLGTFRADLYYRLNVVRITMPPLRDRSKDIALLANHFVAKYAIKTKRKVTGISRDALELLNQYYWPGNVRELENTIERAVVLGMSEVIEIDDLPESIIESSSYNPGTFYEAINNAKRKLIIDALTKSDGQSGLAAKLLGIDRRTLRSQMKKLGIKQTKSIFGVKDSL